MHWFVTDETNKNATPGQFFIYGGLVATDEQVAEIHTATEAIRKKYAFLPGDSFKFHSRSRPKQVSIDQARFAKQELVEELRRIGVRMIVYVILHDVAKKTEAEIMQFALNTVAWAFHRLLTEESATGAMFIDRDDDQHTHLAHLFQQGISVEGSKASLSRIKLFGQTSNNASHLSSAVDIALGAFRYCVNTAGGDGNEVIAKDILPPLADLVWGVGDNPRRVGGYGYIARPLEVRIAKYKDHYTRLSAALQDYSNADTEADENASAATT
jgi:hypothetical protein